MMRIIGGRRAKQFGQAFEEVFKLRARFSGITCERIPDGCRTVGTKNGMPVLCRVKSPFDWIIGLGNQVAFVDTKTIDSDRIPYASIHNDKKRHQIESLSNLGQHGIAGFCTYFRPVDKVVFFNWRLLADMQPKSSLSHTDGIELGSLNNFMLSCIFTEGGVSEYRRHTTA